MKIFVVLLTAIVTFLYDCKASASSISSNEDVSMIDNEHICCTGEVSSRAPPDTYRDNARQSISIASESDTPSVSSQWHHYALENPDTCDPRYDRDTLYLDKHPPIERDQSWPNPLEYRVYHTIGNHFVTPLQHEYAQRYLLDPQRDASRPRERREANDAADYDTYELNQANGRVRARALRHLARLDRDRIGDYHGCLFVRARNHVYANPLLSERTVVERFQSADVPRMPTLEVDAETGRLYLNHIREYTQSQASVGHRQRDRQRNRGSTIRNE